VSRLYEYQSKQLLQKNGIRIPKGAVASSPEEVQQIADKIGGSVVLKVQVWVTGRAGFGGIQFADSPEKARKISQKMFGMKVKNFVIDKIMVEEKLNVEQEFFSGLIIDDSLKAPLLIFSPVGGTGIEEIARQHPDKVLRLPVDIGEGLREYEARNFLRKAGLSGKFLAQVSTILARLYRTARQYDARSAEINPLILTKEGLVYAADCHLAVDDYAVFRHPELKIEVAREFDRPPTVLEKIAYRVEEKDHRGTFYFLQMNEEISEQDKAIGFNGAGGGGSMMSMDAVLNRGFSLANYCDTSGNPSASKVYRAAMIILSQPNLKGYFASGSGVASQEQYHSARGLVKAFREEKLAVPAVIRLGGNFEEMAIEILESYLKDIPAEVEGYGRDDTPEYCAERMEKLIKENNKSSHQVRPVVTPKIPEQAYSFDTFTGRIHIDHQKCTDCLTKGCVEACQLDVLKLENGHPVLSISPEDAKKGKCTECLACEIYCHFNEQDAIIIHLPIPGLKEYREDLIKKKDKG
jgi:succinyl-CoA synthetase beta subunit